MANFLKVPGAWDQVERDAVVGFMKVMIYLCEVSGSKFLMNQRAPIAWGYLGTGYSWQR